MSIQLGAALTAQRTAHHLSQADLATQLQVSPQTVADWETNRRQPALAALVKLSQVLAVPVQDLVGIRSPQPTKRHWWHPFAWNATEKIVPWYASFGFTPVSAGYLEDGIPHLDMVLADKNGDN